MLLCLFNFFIIYFSGKNAAQIYKAIRPQKLDLNIFEPYRLNLSRFDFCYFRETKPNEQEGDVLMVTKIDRCSRNMLEFLKLQDILFKRKIEFISLDLPHSNDPGINRLIATTLSSIAEFENNRRKKRQTQGIRAAQKEGKYQGRKTIINKTLIQKVQYLKERKNLYVTDISKLIGISTPTIYKVLKEHLGYVSNRLIKPEETNAGN